MSEAILASTTVLCDLKNPSGRGSLIDIDIYGQEITLGKEEVKGKKSIIDIYLIVTQYTVSTGIRPTSVAKSIQSDIEESARLHRNRHQRIESLHDGMRPRHREINSAYNTLVE